MSWTTSAIPDLTGRVAVVTGANSGLGAEISRVLAGHGASVVLACRSAERGQAAAGRIRMADADADVRVSHLDLADLGSVKEFAKSLAGYHRSIDLLVNNAGLMAIDHAVTADGFEMQFGVNHLGHFALTARLLPLLAKSPHGGRVATMSSMGHRGGRMNFDLLMPDRGRYRRWNAYTQTKLANLLFTAELQRRLAAAGTPVIAVAAHPGGSNTDLGFEGSGKANALLRQSARFAMPVSQGALPMLRAATEPGLAGGEFFGPRFVAVGGGARRETPSGRARNEADAGRLWKESVRLTGVEPGVSPATR